MGDRPAHIRKAQHNESFLNRELLPKKGFNDWKIVAIFYTAVHYVDAGLARMKIHPLGHTGSDGRNTYVSVHFRGISGKYQTLYNRSRYARYTPDSENQIRADEVQRLSGDLGLFKGL